MREESASGGVGGRLRDLEASGERPRPERAVCGVRTLRSMGARGEAGEERRERPTGPMGEQVISLDLCGELGGRMEALRRSRGVTGDRSGVYCFSEPPILGCLVRGEGWRGE